MTEHLVYGIHAVKAVLNNRHRRFKRLYLSQDREDARIAAIQALALSKQVPVESMALQKMNQRFADCNHQGAVIEVEPLPEFKESDLGSLLAKLEKNALILILDGITDPHNLGACLRTADAAAVDFVIVPKDKSASITPVVSKTASGATESVPLVRVTNLARTMDMLKEEGIWIYGAALEGAQSIYHYDFKGPIAIALGAEGQGLRRLTRERCDGLFYLPMLGSVESLNVSVATGVSLYEAMRQRL